MRYKSKFRPSYLLCPLRYTWHEIDKCIQKLDNEKYSIFNESEDIQDDNNLDIENVNNCIINKSCMYNIHTSLLKLDIG